MRDWDGRYNNERFWSRLYELDLRRELADAGFAPGRMEDYGRTGNWQVVGAWSLPPRVDGSMRSSAFSLGRE